MASVASNCQTKPRARLCVNELSWDCLARENPGQEHEVFEYMQYSFYSAVLLGAGSNVHKMRARKAL